MAATTIDKLDISVYNRYAIQRQMIEQINRQFRIEEAATIPPQTSILDIYPKLSELDLLLGVVAVGAPWAYFFPPKKFQSIHRSPFTFSRIGPSFGSLKKLAEYYQKVLAIPTETEADEEEKRAIERALEQLETINEWLGFIIGRVGQFLQG